MITLATLRLEDRSGLAREELAFEAALTGQGNVALTLEQGIEAGQPWGSVARVMPTLSVADLRRLRDLISSVIFAAEACLEVLEKKAVREAVKVAG
jgi:hypothetical protein